MFACRMLRTTIVTTLVSGLLVLTSPESIAGDGMGCLICHKYPGLVTFEAPDKVTVLHVDEDKFRASVHGEFGCKACHTTIDQVPHTGVEEVTCTDGCHKEDADRIARMPLAGFHEHEQSVLARVGRRTACDVCHAIYPHSESRVTRAFLNLHAAFMFCDVCHTVEQRGDTLCYDWESAEDAEFRGAPFGNYYNPKERKVQESKHFISRIAVFALTEGHKYSLRDPADIPKAIEFQQREPSMTRPEREAGLAYFHRGVKRMKPRAACDGCHASQGMLDLVELGYGKKEADYLAHLNLKALVTQYRTFYFPDLFGEFGTDCAPAAK